MSMVKLRFFKVGEKESDFGAAEQGKETLLGISWAALGLFLGRALPTSGSAGKKKHLTLP